MHSEMEMNLESWLNEPYVPIALGVVAILFVITMIVEMRARKTKMASAPKVGEATPDFKPVVSSEVASAEVVDSISRIIAYARPNHRTPLGRNKIIKFSVERMQWIQPNEASH